ncbi:prolyl hydroxylase family protein [Neptuniibacter sp. QD72_48]|uniref:prolyl hydroxylase family protein n=1 Tax=unclassified Neptuniibacter TaxID=2630693 RepID=UPI0039F44E6F
MGDPVIPTEWQNWIYENRSKNCDPEKMIEVLCDEGFPKRQVTEAVIYALNGGSYHPPYIPRARYEGDDDIEIYSVKDFLNADECLQLIELMRNYQRPSTTTNDIEKYKNHRTSHSSDLALLNSPFVQEIDRRISKMLDISPAFSEGIQGQWYNVGEEFREHTDYFEQDCNEFEQYARNTGQRTWTFMIYLNTVQEGGGTNFPKLNHCFTPEQGKAIIWNNLTPEGFPNPSTVHHGMPVIKGYKAIITKWFRTRGTGNIQYRLKHEYIRPHTQTGFLKKSIPSKLFRYLLRFYTNYRSSDLEKVQTKLTENHQEISPDTIEIPPELQHEIHKTLQPLAEAWSGCLLKPLVIDEINIYSEGSTTKYGRTELGAISILLNLHQKIERPWPIIIEDHFYRSHKVSLVSGQLLMYESKRLLPFSPVPLQGEHCTCMLAHYELDQ